MTPQPLTDKQIKVLKYVKKRATPPTTTEVALQTKMSKMGAHVLLTRLVRYGYLERISRLKLVAERRYRFLTDVPT